MAGVEQELETLADLPRSQLVERWTTLYRTHPPKGISRRLLILAIAYELQAKRYGGLKPAVKRRLQNIADNLAAGDHVIVPARTQLQLGTRFVREWNGQTHVVEAEANGFVWNGERYRSLSAIARAITGARWSGPRFFGLQSTRAT